MSRASWSALPTARAGGDCCRPSTTDELLDASRDIDVLVIARNVGDSPAMPPADAPDTVLSTDSGKARWPRYLLALLATLVATGVCWVFHSLYPQARRRPIW